MKLRVWWVPQVPMKPFIVPVSGFVEAKKVLTVLAEYDLFQFHNRVKGDYCNAGGLCVFDEKDDHDSPEGSWVDWYDEESGDDIDHITEERCRELDYHYDPTGNRKIVAWKSEEIFASQEEAQDAAAGWADANDIDAEME